MRGFVLHLGWSCRICQRSGAGDSLKLVNWRFASLERLDELDPDRLFQTTEELKSKPTHSSCYWCFSSVSLLESRFMRLSGFPDRHTSFPELERRISHLRCAEVGSMLEPEINAGMDNIEACRQP